MTLKQLDRKALMINLGGGVIGDMGGFCASTYKRGIDFIQIPTTLLSQVDASVGGKLGVDFNGLKNHIGVFKEPIAVFINDDFLSTLNSRELRSGYAEIIKHALIADSNKWVKLQSIQSLQEVDWLPLIKESVAIKEYITTTDPTEKGLRKVLNFGHTIGHAIETHYLFITDKRLLHGEAIAIGMICEAWLAFKKGYLSISDVEEIKSYILNIYPYTSIPLIDIEPILTHIYQDKKNEGGKLLYSLLNKIGDSNFNIQITYEETKEALLYYVNH
jgi:3-dehydroquinate synthase